MGAGLRLLCILIHRGWRDRNEGVVLIFRRWSRSRCPLRTYPGEESGTAHRRLTRPLGNGAWRTVGDMDANEEARCSACCGRLPCRRALRPAAFVPSALNLTVIGTRFK